MASSDASAAGAGTRAAARLSQAAAVLLLRRAPALEVYWIERAALLSYLGGFHAFPGGRLAEDDAAVPMAGEIQEAEVPRRAAAARELFEEAGVLLARPADGARARLPDAAEAHAARAALVADELRFSEFLAERGLAVDGAALLPAGRWISPAITPRGFDTRFYLALCPAEQSPSVVRGELESGEWIAPAAARAAWARGEALVATPVQRSLAALEELARVVDGGAGAEEFAAALTRCSADLCAGPQSRFAQGVLVELTPGVVVLPLATSTIPPATHTNCYVVGEGECVIVDPGSADPGEQAVLEDLLERLAAGGRRPVAIVLTHGDPDHTAGTERLRRRLGLPVWAHPLLAARLGAERALADGEELSLDGGPSAPWRLEALHTPGHARDHLALVERRRGVLIAGDLVSGLSSVVIDPPEGDLDDYVASLARLARLPLRSLFPGHGPPGGGALARLAQLAEHRRWREERVRAALASGAGTLEELVPRVYADVPESRWPWAARSLAAHLASLERRALAARDAVGRWTATPGSGTLPRTPRDTGPSRP
jgi:glyoxylase-like metal-dependent hydrolase (beta-lactamase superfamily II)/8-oxo-dGTP pyrophosphatase MutT (NUDIX family)